MLQLKLLIPNFWRKKTIISILLKPFSYLYSLICVWRAKIDPQNIYQPKAKVITIGNITMGGAGKTPVSLSIAKILQNYSKHKIVILTRGYRGSLSGPLMVESTHQIEDIGDEALLIAKQFSTCVAKNRIEGIKFLESLGYDIIITDDGLQDERFIKALTILVVDSYFGFGNGLIFPAGPLREDINTGINKANLIVIIGEGDFSLPKELPILKAKLVGKILLSQQKLVAFAGIGNPEKFFHSVVESEGEMVEKLVFGDHHQYSDKELARLVDLAKKHQAELITTEKDYTRVSEEFKPHIRTLPVTLIWEDEELLLKRLLSL